MNLQSRRRVLQVIGAPDPDSATRDPRDAVILNLGVRTKRDVLAEMASALAKVEPQIDSDRLLEVLLERETEEDGAPKAAPHVQVAGQVGMARSSGLKPGRWHQIIIVVDVKGAQVTAYVDREPAMDPGGPVPIKSEDKEKWVLREGLILFGSQNPVGMPGGVLLRKVPQRLLRC